MSFHATDGGFRGCWRPLRVCAARHVAMSLQQGEQNNCRRDDLRCNGIHAAATGGISISEIAGMKNDFFAGTIDADDYPVLSLPV